jgi:hypothetical protein
MLAAWTALVIVSLACLATFVMYTSNPFSPITEPLDALGGHSEPPVPVAPHEVPVASNEVAVDPFGPSSVLKGEPTMSFKGESYLVGYLQCLILARLRQFAL